MAPIWAGALVHNSNVRTLEGLQRRIALRTVIAYRTVSNEAILVVAGMIPAHLAAAERKTWYLLKRQGATDKMAEIRTRTLEKWQEEWNGASNGRWTRRLI